MVICLGANNIVLFTMQLTILSEDSITDSWKQGWVGRNWKHWKLSQDNYRRTTNYLWCFSLTFSLILTKMSLTAPEMFTVKVSGLWAVWGKARISLLQVLNVKNNAVIFTFRKAAIKSPKKKKVLLWKRYDHEPTRMTKREMRPNLWFLAYLV